jgi:hypothetical protein
MGYLYLRRPIKGSGGKRCLILATTADHSIATGLVGAGVNVQQ